MASSVISKLDSIFDCEDIKLHDDSNERIPESSCDGANDNVVVPNSELDRFIQNEIDQRVSKSTTWRMLEQCFKWSCIKEYLKVKGKDDDTDLLNELKTMLVKRMLLNVIYDNKTQKIVCLNHKGL